MDFRVNEQMRLVIWSSLGTCTLRNPTDFDWDVVSNISAGSINTTGIAGRKPKELVGMMEYLQKSVTRRTRSRNYETNDFCKRNQPQSNCFSRRCGNRRDCLNQQSYFDFAQAGLSSVSIPVVFPPQSLKDHVLMDRGTV